MTKVQNGHLDKDDEYGDKWRTDRIPKDIYAFFLSSKQIIEFRQKINPRKEHENDHDDEDDHLGVCVCFCVGRRML